LTALVILTIPGGFPCRAAMQTTNAEYGPSPELVAPTKSILPTIRVAKAKGWNDDAKPQSAEGTTVTAYARKLQHPRWLYVLPNGDVLVAESETPVKPDDSKGVGGKVHKLVMKRAGSGAHPSADRITLLRESKPGSVETHVFLQGLNSPIGMALVGNTFYVANSDAVLSFPYRSGDTELRSEATQLTVLPAGTINHHWTKSLIASPDGRHLYVGVGSNSNAGENGLNAEHERAAVWEIDTKTGNIEYTLRVCAIRWGWRGSRKAALCGLPSTNATSWAIKCPRTT